MNETPILVVDDDPDVLASAQMLLKQEFARVDICQDPEQIPARLGENACGVVLLDMNFTPGARNCEQGLQWLKTILKLDPDKVVVLMTAFGDIDTAVQAMKTGAADFVLKPWENDRLLATLIAAARLAQSRQTVARLRHSNDNLRQELARPAGEIIGHSPAIRSVFGLIDKAAPTDANVLITGENGTGKELAAREIHRRSLRAEAPFISVDLGAVPETLFESELFGHKKGAFTGAQSDRAGRFQAANGGTLFLDEIGNLPLHLQSKLLTALEQRQVAPVGSDKPAPVDIRLIAATNLSPEALTDEKRFRQDLLYRINTVEIDLPPLRVRGEDIPLLAEYFLGLYCNKYHKPRKRLGADAVDTLQAYTWPGNIRELRHIIERVVILSENTVLEADDFAPLAAYPQGIDTHRNTPNLMQLEQQAIRKALKKHSGNISHTASELGITRAALYRRMEKYGI